MKAEKQDGWEATVNQAIEFVQSVYDFTLPRDMQEDAMPFGTCDYYGMEKLLVDLKALTTGARAGDWETVTEPIKNLSKVAAENAHTWTWDHDRLLNRVLSGARNLFVERG